MKNILNKLNSVLLLLASSASFNHAAADILDPLFPKQWALKNNGQTIYLQDSDLSRQKVIGTHGVDINYLDTSLFPSPKAEIIVAVLDSGIDLLHPELQGKIWYNSKLCTNAPNAKNLPCNGYNFLENNTSLLDDIGHGTHVSGIIAANKNSIGVMGAGDPRIKIMPLKVLNNSVNGFVYNGKLITDVIADAMIFAIKNGAEVINLSLGWPKLIDTQKVRAAFQLAEEQNVIVIAASGNNNKDLPTFPCSYESVICVGAHDNLGNLTEFSNHGSKVDVVAPGEYIISAFPTTLESRVLRIKNFEVKRGSSQAAPFVTASIANLKLLRPGIKNDEVRKLLFKSSKVLVNSTNKRFVKFGRLDQRKLLEMQSNDTNGFLNPQIKNLTEIKFKQEDHLFSFTIPLKNISATPFTGQVCINSTSAAIVIDSPCVDLENIQALNLVDFKVNGSIVDLSADSQINFALAIDGNNFSMPLFFTRDLANDPKLNAQKVLGGNFDEMGIISNGRRLSRLQRVLDKHQLLGFPEYFFLEKLKQVEGVTNVSLLTKKSGELIIKNFILPKLTKVVSIHRFDINHDGKLDYMIYALSSDKLNLKLFFFDENFQPLFAKNSEWTLSLTAFEGLPVEGNQEKFDWVKINTDLGLISVPSFLRSFELPELDNSKNILDRIVGRAPHLFYLKPVVSNLGVTVELRVLDNVLMLQNLKTKMGLDSSYRLELLKAIPASVDSYKNGVVKFLIKATDGENSKFLELSFSENNFKQITLPSLVPLEGSAIYSFFDLKENRFTNNVLFTSLLSRSRANFTVNSSSGIEYSKDLINTWENPILSLIGAFSSGSSKTYFTENRYTISYSDQNGAFKYELPIYRDSSFPGQNFSETLTPIVSDGAAGVYVNSTLIFGERIYSMIGTNNGLVRPLSLSINIPDGCIPLNPELLSNGKSTNFMFLCTDPSKQVFLKSLPMSQN